MVLGEDDRRVVVSVALHHGGTVDVAIRTADGALAREVARTHGELDHALRGHGLALGDLASHDTGHRDGSGRDRADRPAAPSPRLPRAAAADAPTSISAGPGDPRLRALA